MSDLIVLYGLLASFVRFTDKKFFHARRSLFLLPRHFLSKPTELSEIKMSDFSCVWL